jgi:hypothetical protein
MEVLMGIAKDSQGRSMRGPLDGVELVRARPDSPSSTNQTSAAADNSRSTAMIASGNESLMLTSHCVLYRNRVSGHRVFNVVPLRNIDSFKIQAYRSNAMRAAAIACLLASIVSAAWLFAWPRATAWFFASTDLAPAGFQHLWLPIVLLACGLVALLAYGVDARTRLVIYTLSGRNQIELSLSTSSRGSAEEFMVDLEEQLQRADRRA